MCFFRVSANGWVLPMVAQLKTKIKITNKMTTKNKFSENNFNATIGNTVLCDGFLIPMTDFVIEYAPKFNPFGTDEQILCLDYIHNYAKFLKQPLKLEMFVPCDENENILEEPQMRPERNSFDEEDMDYDAQELYDYIKAKKKVLFEGFKPYEDYECAKYEEVYVDEEVCDGKFTVEDLIKDAGKTKIKLSQTSLNAIFG